MVEKRMQNWVTRTIRNGTVKVGGITFRPFLHDDSPVYDGRWDGQRVVFARYWTDDWYHTHLWLSHFEGETEDDWPGKACVDGVFRWADWIADLDTMAAIASDEHRSRDERWDAACQIAMCYNDDSYRFALFGHSARALTAASEEQT